MANRGLLVLESPTGETVMSKNTPHFNTEADPGVKLSLSTKILLQGEMTHLKKRKENTSEHPQAAYIPSSIQTMLTCDEEIQTFPRATEKNISYPKVFISMDGMIQR